jgi:predicted nucleotidyltransferase
MTTGLAISKDAIGEFCRRNGIRRLALFGSILRQDFSPDSDIDVLVEFEPGVVAGYLDLAQMELELSRLAGRKVDLRTAGELSETFRDAVLAQAVEQYVRR